MDYKIVVKEKVTIEKNVETQVSAKKYVGLKIKELREGKKMSQADLAFEISFSRSNLSNLENGRFSISLGTLEKICSFFNCKSTDILPF